VLVDVFMLGTGMTRKGSIAQPLPRSYYSPCSAAYADYYLFCSESSNALAHPHVSWAPFATDADSTPAFYLETPVCKWFNDQLLLQRLNVRQMFRK
jgi:hypothetical protein